ncbi:uncharacterized protein [Coffea arabica]|uniref:Reverse transcriptase domain-containing protein n=1 Tax=Coffea arabica TaxID=13443 RepID=A0ABM4WQ77_COFAR
MVQHLGRDPSDHDPLLLSVATRLDNKPRPFRFLNVWTTHPGLLRVIKDCWAQPVNGSPLQVLVSRLRNVKNTLKQWSRTTFGDIFEGAYSAERVVAEAETEYDLDPTEQRQSELDHARAQLRRALVVDEGFWKQTAPVKWLLVGDRNTKYFHSLVTEKRRRAVIHRVRGAAGEWIEGESQIGEAAVGFFQELFTAEGGLPSHTGLEVIPKLETEQDNSRLTDVPSLTEVKNIVFAMDGRAQQARTGLQGNSLPLLGRWWHLIYTGQSSAFSVGLNYLEVSRLPRLCCCPRWRILKISRSFGRSVYATLLTKSSPNYYRQVVHTAFSSRHGVYGKEIPFLRPYSLLELRCCLEPQCATHTEGLYLFRVPPRCPIVTHLAFADDVIIFSNGGRWSLRLIKRVLQDYSVASGQQLNPQKSCFLTHPRAPSQRVVVSSQVLRYNRRAFPIRYFGCPLYAGRSKKVYYADTYNAVATRILSWKNQILSPGGRVVLIQSVLASMPIHLLAAASPPKRMLVALEKLFAKFLWGYSDSRDKFHWMRWADLCRPRDERGVGLQGLKQGSQAWRRMVTIQRFGEDNITWVIREGALEFWHDNWMGSGALYDKMEVFHDHSVADFVDRRAWNVDMLCQFLDGELVKQVLELDPPPGRGNDRMVWALTNSGVFSTALAYSLIRDSGSSSWLFGRIWQQGLQSRCWCCQNPQEEDLNHVFCSGEGARLVWHHFENTTGEFNGVHTVRHMVWSCWLRRGTNVYVKFVQNILPSVVCWVLWKARNEGVFEGRKIRVGVIVNRIIQLQHDYLQSRFLGVQCSAPTWEGMLRELGSHQRRIVIKPVYWATPREGYKLNSDGCSRGNPGRSGGVGLCGIVEEILCSATRSTSES